MQRESAPGKWNKEGGKQRFLPDLRQFVANILQTTQRRKLGFPCFSASSCIYKRSATAVQHISIVNLILSFQLLILDIFRHTSVSSTYPKLVGHTFRFPISGRPSVGHIKKSRKIPVFYFQKSRYRYLSSIPVYRYFPVYRRGLMAMTTTTMIHNNKGD